MSSNTEDGMTYDDDPGDVPELVTDAELLDLVDDDGHPEPALEDVIRRELELLL